MHYISRICNWTDGTDNMARPKRADISDVNRRNELIATTEKLFKEKGLHATTTRDITEASNMKSGSPFHHFAGKQDVLFAGVESGLLNTDSGVVR